MQRILPLFLIGCVIVGESAHNERVRSVTEADTDTDTDTDADTDTDTDTDTDIPLAAPQLLEAEWRFRFDDFNIYQGLQLLIRVTDADGDLEGGSIEIQGGQIIPWISANVEARADDWYLVPIDLDLGPPCAPTGNESLNIFVRDFSDLASDTQQLDVGWAAYAHDESGISSADQCEPCIDNKTTADLPFVACGLKKSMGYIDFYDAVSLDVPGSYGQIQATVNYGPDANDLRFSLVYPPDFHFVQVVSTGNNLGHRIDAEAPVNATTHEFAIDATAYFYSGTWTMFLQDGLPLPEPPP